MFHVHIGDVHRLRTRIRPTWGSGPMIKVATEMGTLTQIGRHGLAHSRATEVLELLLSFRLESVDEAINLVELRHLPDLYDEVVEASDVVNNWTRLSA